MDFLWPFWPELPSWLRYLLSYIAFGLARGATVWT